MPAAHNDDILTPAQAAAKFKVNPKTVGRWAKSEKLPYFRTPGGHRRYRQSDLQKFLQAQ